MLAYPDYSKPFLLRTDASRLGLGAVLCQEKDGKYVVVAYGSRSVRGPERNYSAHKLEFLALKWAVTKKFHDYLYGNRFTVTTDHNPLTYVLTSAKLDATCHRWLAELSVYDFEIKYKPGRLNSDADALSRMYRKGEEENVISADLVRNICKVEEVEDEGLIECMCVSASIDVPSEPKVMDRNIDWKKEQLDDQVVGRVYRLVEIGVLPS